MNIFIETDDYFLKLSNKNLKKLTFKCFPHKISWVKQTKK